MEIIAPGADDWLPRPTLLHLLPGPCSSADTPIRSDGTAARADLRFYAGGLRRVFVFGRLWRRGTRYVRTLVPERRRESELSVYGCQIISTGAQLSRLLVARNDFGLDRDVGRGRDCDHRIRSQCMLLLDTS